MEKSVKLKLRIDYKAMKYFNIYNLKYKRKFYLYYLILIAICIGGCVATIISKSYFLSVLFGLFGIYLIYQLLNVEKMIDRQITAYFQHHRPIEQEIMIDEENITISSPRNPEKELAYEWIHITSIHEIPQYYFLFLHKQPVIISKDPEDIIEGSQEMLAEIIKEKAAAKPYKLVDKEIIRHEITFEYPDYDAILEAHETDQDFEEAEEIKVEVENPEDVEKAGEVENFEEVEKVREVEAEKSEQENND